MIMKLCVEKDLNYEQLEGKINGISCNKDIQIVF